MQLDMPDLAGRCARDLRELTAFPDRRVGGPGNRAATALFTQRAERAGFTVTRTAFECIDWTHGDARLAADGETFEAFVGPYSLPCDASAPLAAASTVDALESGDYRGKVLLLHGEVASGQVMPKAFTFYNPDEHRRIVAALERGAPAAVVAATGRDPDMVGSQYPFPLFEDGDFDIPNGYMRDVDGERLLAHVGREVRFRLDSGRLPSHADHVVATLPGSGSGRIVVSAHIDSRMGSPGALDNGTGVVTLLCLLELLAGFEGRRTVEIVPFNGEDNYANPGELMWISENVGRFQDIVVGINIDDSSMVGGINHVSFYNCPEDVERATRAAMAARPGIDDGPSWVQGDHMVFLLHGRPAVAVASSRMGEFMGRYAHSERDTMDLADPDLMAETVGFLHEVVVALAG